MKTSKLTLYIFLGLLLGTFVGWQFPEIGSKMQPLATVFLNMIKMIIAPLLFSVIVTVVVSLLTKKPSNEILYEAFDKPIEGEIK